MIYAEIDANKNLIQAFDVGDEAMPVREGFTYRELATAPSWMHPTPTSALQWQDAWNAPQWIELGTLDQLRAAKGAELSTACGTYIVAGLVSSALGAPYTYASDMTNQHNLLGLVTRSLYPSNPTTWTEKFPCTDANGVWARVEHTAVQLQQVGNEMIARIAAALAQCDALTTQANAATAAQLPGIVWTAP